MRVVLLTLLLLIAPGADAHAILMDSQPALRGVASPGPLAITLRFNSRIDSARSRLLLIRADHSQSALTLAPPDAAGDRLQAQAELPPGNYVLRWQVLAVDGHITRGDVPFSVAVPEAAVAGRPPTP